MERAVFNFFLERECDLSTVSDFLSFGKDPIQVVFFFSGSLGSLSPSPTKNSDFL